MITTVVFDLDDTLYDEIDYCMSGFRAVAEFLSNPPQTVPANLIYEILWKEFSAGNRIKTFNTALDKLEIPYNDKLIAELINVYRTHIPQITLPKDSRDVLEQLSKKYILAMLTDGFLPAQKLKVQALRIEKFFKCIIYTEELGRDCWKPSTAGFEKILHNLEVKPENAAYIADNEKKDFIAPNKLGFLTILLIRDAHIHPMGGQKPKFSAQHIIRKIGQLPALLMQLRTQVTD
jgi:putative hydrolase of the HAD superfamily